MDALRGSPTLLGASPQTSGVNRGIITEPRSCFHAEHGDAKTQCPMGDPKYEQSKSSARSGLDPIGRRALELAAEVMEEEDACTKVQSVRQG